MCYPIRDMVNWKTTYRLKIPANNKIGVQIAFIKIY